MNKKKSIPKEAIVATVILLGLNSWNRGFGACNPKHKPEGPCTQIVYTSALKYSLHRYFRVKVSTIWVHGPVGKHNPDGVYRC